MSSETEQLFGKTRRWKEGDVLFAENDWVSGAYVVTTDPEKLSGFRMGWHPYRDTEMCVEYIRPDQAEAWNQPEIPDKKGGATWQATDAG